MTNTKKPFLQQLSEYFRHPATELVLLALIILFALALRLFKLGAWSFWIDELFTLGRVRQIYRNPLNLAPVSIYLIALVLKILPLNEWSARLAPALVGVIGIPLIYFPVRKWFGPFVALLTATFLSISPFHIYWSQNVRFYTTLVLFYSLAMFAFYYWLEQNNWKYLLVFFVFLGLATLERDMAPLLVGSGLAYFFALKFLPYFGKPAGLSWKNLALLLVPTVLAGGAMLYSGRDILASNFIAFPSNPVRLLFSTIYDFGLPLFLFGLLGGLYLVIQRSRVGLYLFLVILVPFVVILSVSPFMKSESRYLFMTLPGWAVLAAYAVKELLIQVQKLPRLLAFGVLLILIADPFSQDLLYYSYQNGNRPDWKGAYAFVRENWEPGDTLYTTRPEIGNYYMGQDVNGTDVLKINNVTSAGKRTWFVLDDRTTFSSGNRYRWIGENTRLMAVRDVSIPGKIMEMRVYLYEPPSGP